MPEITLTDTVLVLGAGDTGHAVATWLAGEAAKSGSDFRVLVLDNRANDELKARASDLCARGVAVRLGAHGLRPEDLPVSLVVASPGLAPTHPLVEAARATGAEVISEPELAFRTSAGVFAAVTGTNGKTTTTALLGHLMVAAGIPSEVCGNIGTPVISVAPGVGEGAVLVTEISSFHAALMAQFRPRVAVLLNITPDHLDWHGGLEGYARDKAKVFARQGHGDDAVIFVDDPGAAAWVDQLERQGVNVHRVSLSDAYPGGAWEDDGWLVLDGADGPVRLVRVEELKLRGSHNVVNALSASMAARCLGADADAIRDGLRTFMPIEHRLEPVGTFGGIEWFNDSKATNPDSVYKAVEALSDRDLVVLLGGRTEEMDMSPLARAVAVAAVGVVVFGEAAPVLEAGFAGTGVVPVRVERLEEAVHEAARMCPRGGAVVLSPACKSFDAFASYVERGRAFKRMVACVGDES